MFLAPLVSAAAPLISAAMPTAIAAGTLAAGKAIGSGIGNGTVKVVGNAIDAVGDFLGGGDDPPQVPPNAAQQAFIANQQMMQKR